MARDQYHPYILGTSDITKLGWMVVSIVFILITYFVCTGAMESLWNISDKRD